MLSMAQLYGLVTQRLLVPAAIALTINVSAAQAGQDLLAVTLDQAKIVRIPAGTQTLIIGNPIVADVTMLKNIGMMVVTGKSFGQTNLIAIDGSGNPVSESIIRVSGASESMLTVYRGMDRESYSCTPHCEPILNLGDSTKFLSDVSGQVTSRNTLASPIGQAH
jgi:Pilus formation protein N terminal region